LKLTSCKKAYCCCVYRLQPTVTALISNRLVSAVYSCDTQYGRPTIDLSAQTAGNHDCVIYPAGTCIIILMSQLGQK